MDMLFVPYGNIWILHSLHSTAQHSSTGNVRRAYCCTIALIACLRALYVCINTYSYIFLWCSTFAISFSLRFSINLWIHVSVYMCLGVIVTMLHASSKQIINYEMLISQNMNTSSKYLRENFNSFEYVHMFKLVYSFVVLVNRFFAQLCDNKAIATWGSNNAQNKAITNRKLDRDFNAQWVWIKSYRVTTFLELRKCAEMCITIAQTIYYNFF